MSNNTSNYQEYTFSKLLEQYDKILVPMIQRDYAQGRTDKKATDVRNNLLNDIFNGKDVHFDLVFGSKEKRIIDGKEMNCFIPVDGQQRLTTLFLLHLYRQKAGKTNTELDLSKFSYDTRRAASDFCKSITSEEWTVQKEKKVSDVIKDSSWFMNYWEKDPTVEGMLNMLDAIHEKCREITDYPNLNKVTFFFFDLESNGLNENLYLKMNSRGKPLTAFENLKAKIEKLLKDSMPFDKKWFPEDDGDATKDEFKEKWKFYMDRNWTDTFWDKDNAEKYDVYIAEFIVRFLSGYWAAFSVEEVSTQEKTLEQELKEINNKNSYVDYIPFEPIEKVLNLENAFPKLAYALTTLIDNSKIKPYWSKGSDEIKVSEKSDYKIIAVVFTYVLFDGDNSAMRFAWNMAENYVTGYENFITYCTRVKKIKDKYNPDTNNAFYRVLSDNSFDNPSAQLKEEVAKAQQIIDENGNFRKYTGTHKKENGDDYNFWEEIIIDAESYAFFNGAIRFLFQNEKGEVDSTIPWNTKDFDTKWANAQKYFNKDGNGVAQEYSDNAILLRYYISQFKEWREFWHFDYDNEPSTWKQLLISYRYMANHSILMNLLAKNPDFSSFVSSLDKYEEKYKELQENVHNDLVKTNILVKSSEWNMKLNWRYDCYCLYPYNTKTGRRIYVIANSRNPILSDLIINGIIETDQKIDGSPFFWGWDVNFIYCCSQEKFNFRWDCYNNVYLMETEKPGEKIIRDYSKDSNFDKYYCFNASSISETTDFEKKLNTLIDEFKNRQN